MKRAHPHVSGGLCPCSAFFEQVSGKKISTMLTLSYLSTHYRRRDEWLQSQVSTHVQPSWDQQFLSGIFFPIAPGDYCREVCRFSLTFSEFTVHRIQEFKIPLSPWNIFLFFLLEAASHCWTRAWTVSFLFLFFLL